MPGKRPSERAGERERRRSDRALPPAAARAKKSTGAKASGAKKRSPASSRNATAVKTLLDQLEAKADGLDDHGRALGELAMTLAETLDKGAGLSTAAISRELRATLNAISEGRDGRDDDEDWRAGLSTGVRHTEEPRPANARATSGRSRPKVAPAADAVAATRPRRGARARPE